MSLNHIASYAINLAMKTLYGLLIGLFCLSSTVLAQQQLLDRVVAVVNNDAIAQSELDIVMRPLYEEYSQQYQGKILYQKLSEVRLKILNQLIEDRLVLQEAKDQGIEINATELNRQLKMFKDQFSSAQEMEDVLRLQGVTLKKIREQIKHRAMIRALHDREIKSHVIVSPLEIQRYYEDNIDLFTQKNRLKPRSITIKKDDESRRKGLKDEAAWELIHELKSRIANGDDFGEIAKTYSHDVNAGEGGLGDWINQGDMIEAIDKVIFQLEAKRMSEVIETKMGYHLFYVEEKEAGRTLSLEQAREQIRLQIFQEKSEARFKNWMEELKSKAYISIR